MVGGAVFGDGALTIHQEAVPPPLFRQGVLVAFSYVVIQLALLIADGLDELRRRKKKKRHGRVKR